MMRKKGFILLEVLISVMMSSFVFMSLAAGLFQLSRGVSFADTRIDMSQRLSTIFMLMERDFIGTVIPVQAAVVIEMQKNKKTSQKIGALPKQEVQKREEPLETLAETPEQAQEKKEEKPVTHIFYSTFSNNQTNLISCITCNPLPVYWSERAGKAKPRIVRVIYRLKPDPQEDNENVFLLTRQEGSALDFNLYTQSENSIAREYVVASGIKALQVRYGYIEKKDAESAPKIKPLVEEGTLDTKKDEKPTYHIKDDWPDPQKEEHEEKKLTPPLIPHYAEVSITLWDAAYKRDQNFKFVINFIADEHQLKEQASLRFIPEKPLQKPVQKTVPPLPTPQLIPQKAMVNNSKYNEKILPEIPHRAAQNEAIASPDMQEILNQYRIAENNQIPVEQFLSEEILDAIAEKLAHTEIPEGVTEIVAQIDEVDEQGNRVTVFKGPVKITPEILGRHS